MNLMPTYICKIIDIHDRYFMSICSVIPVVMI